MYEIRAVCCLIGAHYYCFVRNEEGGGDVDAWTLYNDEVTQSLKNWFQVVKNMIDIKVFPTLLFYQQAS